MGKRIRHMGMAMTEGEHKKWHRDGQAMTKEQHKALMEEMGIGKKDDKKWHKGHEPSVKSSDTRRLVNPFAIGGGFLDYCVKHEWLIREGNGRNAKYFLTKDGKGKLEKFGIRI